MFRRPPTEWTNLQTEFMDVARAYAALESATTPDGKPVCDPLYRKTRRGPVPTADLAIWSRTRKWLEKRKSTAIAPDGKEGWRTFFKRK